MLRLVDANLDRLSEGLRILEDIARFILSDADIAEKLKVMRHTFATDDPVLEERLITARDSLNDVGAKTIPSLPSQRRDFPDLVAANAKRAEQSLRLLEEFAKLPQTADFLRDKNFEKERFNLY